MGGSGESLDRLSPFPHVVFFVEFTRQARCPEKKSTRKREKGGITHVARLAVSRLKIGCDPGNATRNAVRKP